LKNHEKKADRKIFLIIALITIATITYQTERVSATAPRIIVTPTPHGINADGRTHEIITIELQTTDGTAFLANRDIRVQISSSNLNVGTVEAYVTIPEGKSYTKAEFTSTANSGITIISASSPGFETGDTQLQIYQSNFDSRLLVYTSPNSMPAEPNVEGLVTVQIINSEGEPYLAIDDIEIKLISSNHSICTVNEDITIQRGANYATTTFKTVGDLRGDAIISAQADGFNPGSDFVNTLNYTGTPAGVSIFYGPNLVLPDGELHQAVTIQVQDDKGNPAKSTSPRTIYLSSSNINIVTIDSSVIIPPGSYHETAEITTFNENGNSVISASSPGLYPDSKEITVEGQVPTILDILAHPSILLADGSAYDIVTVQLLDEEGKPVEASEDFEVFLTSSNTYVGTLPESITINAGDSYVNVPFRSGGVSGESALAAFSPGVEPAETMIEAVTFGLNVTLSTPTSIRINQTFTAVIQVTSGSEPVPGAEIEWSALGGVILTEDQTTDEDGIATLQLVQKYDQLKISAGVSKTGYEPNEASKTIKTSEDIEQSELTVTILGAEVKVFTLLIGLAIIIAIAIGAYVYIKYRNSKNLEPDDLEIYT